LQDAGSFAVTLKPAMSGAAASRLLRAVESAAPAAEDIALAIAGDEYPALRLSEHRAKLDRWGETLRQRLHEVAEAERLAGLVRFMYRELGFRGNDEDYYDPRNSYLNEVLERRLGNPVSLAVVLIALGSRAGLLVEGVPFPGNFLVRVGGRGGSYVDPYDGRSPLPVEALCELAQRELHASPAAARQLLEPAGPRAIGVRLLYNLYAIYRHRDHAHALVVCDRLVELTGSAAVRCDRGLHALALGAAEGAVADLEAYLEAFPHAPDADLVRRVAARARSIEHSPS